MVRPTRLAVLLGASALLATAAGAGCASTGHDAPPDDDGGASGLDGGAATGVPAPPAVGVSLFAAACDPTSPRVDWSPVRRISRVEYDNMVRDLLGDTTQPANGFPPESPMTMGVNFQTNTYAGASVLAVQDYVQAAEALADSAVHDQNRLTNTILQGCSAPTDACAQQFIAKWVDRAFRGQLDAAESAALFQLYSDVKGALGDWTAGIQAVITAVLESPRFLYVMELGTGAATGSVVPLSPYEIAARLALFLWRSVPDDALMQAAAQGNLSTPDQIAQQATRMLTDPSVRDRARGALDDFTTQWMQLQATGTMGKDTQYKAWSSDVGQSMKQEALLDVSQLVLAKNGGLADLLASPSSYVDDRLAGFYGVSKGSACVDPNSGAAGGSWCATPLPNRAGILTTGAVLSTQAHTTLPSSVLRGKLVRENVLCDPIPPPPPGIKPAPTSVPDGGTTRDVLEAHFTNPSCASCHQYMDPIGFGFGHFDATGAYQATDANGLPPPQGGWPAIDASGQVLAPNNGELATTFDGAVDLVTQLSTATQVEQCFALQELRYALSRIETAADACSARQVYGAFSSSGFNIQKLLLAIVQSDAFRYRSVEAPGSACQ